MRHRAPELIVEFSPKRGWSTLHMAAALEDNGRGHILSFEVEPVYGNLFPLVQQWGVVHVHNVEAPPEVIAEGRTFYSDKPSGEEERLTAYLLARRECYRWFSVAALVRDAGYLAAVRVHGGGEVALPTGRRRPASQRSADRL